MIETIQIGDRLVHKSNALLSGTVCGRDEHGPIRPSGPCVWLDHHGRQRGFWLRVGEAELVNYRVIPKGDSECGGEA